MTYFLICSQGRSFALNIGAARKYWDGRKGYFFGKSGFYCIFMWQSQNIGTAGAPLPPLELRPWYHQSDFTEFSDLAPKKAFFKNPDNVFVFHIFLCYLKKCSSCWNKTIMLPSASVFPRIRLPNAYVKCKKKWITLAVSTNVFNKRSCDLLSSDFRRNM